MFSKQFQEELADFVELSLQILLGVFLIGFSIIGFQAIVGDNTASKNTATLVQQDGFTFWRGEDEAVLITPSQEYYGKMINDVWVGGYRYKNSGTNYCEAIYNGGIVRDCTLTEMSIVFSDLDTKVEEVKNKN
ncbi:hypothetical protein KY314_03240 [Candidatus Woesearchaeota archaeon]|nr:hypothetical protein [Candidatus Woesearchaeota archaeon]